jgi:hypothetical protein
MMLCSAWRWAGAVALCAIPTHDDETVMNGAPGSWAARVLVVALEMGLVRCVT